MERGDARGNPYRCGKCGNLAGKDGWCKVHRPKVHGRYPIVRDNYINGFQVEHGTKESRWPDTFGAVTDHYGYERDYGKQVRK